MAMSDVVVVLGMHRSGTSAVAGTLTMLGGVAPATLMHANFGNPRGYFESVAFMNFHDELLASAGTYWQDWRLFNPGFYRSSVAADYRRRAKDLFASEFNGAGLPVLKDPRICRFVPFWLDILTEMKATPRIVMPIRSPLEVAHSLNARQGLSLPHGLLLWLRHILDAEVQTRAEARSIFTWNSFLSDWRGTCEKISADASLSWPRLSDRASYEIDHFLGKELIHHEIKHAELITHTSLHEWTLDAYEALLELARNPMSNSAMDKLDQVRGLLDQSSKLFGRILVDYEVKIEDLQTQTHVLTGERDLLQVRQGEIQHESAAAAAEWLDRVQRAESAYEEALREKEALSQSRAAVSAELDTIRYALQRSVADLAARQKEIVESAVTTAEWIARAQQAESTREEALREKEALSQSLAAVTAEFDIIRDALQSSVTQLAAQQRDMAASAIAFADLEARVTQTESALGEAIAERDALAQQQASHINELADARAAIAALTNKHTEALSALDLSCAEKAATEAARVELAAKLDRAFDENYVLVARLDQTSAIAQRNEQAACERESMLHARYHQALTAAQKVHETEIHVLRAQLVDTESELSNRIKKGARRGRWISLPLLAHRRLLARRLIRSGLFDTAWYLAEYPEAGKTEISAVEHYVETGFCRGYRPNPFFDTRWYLDHYEDVRRSGINPLLHYALHGYKESRDPGPAFETDFYLASNPDVRAKDVNPLAHYLLYGRHEGRRAKPPA